MRAINNNKLRFFENIRQLIAEDKIIKALDQFEIIPLEKEHSNFILQQRARFAEVNKQNYNNTISLVDLNHEKAKIRFAILSMLDEIEKEDFEVAARTQQSSINRTLLRLVFLIGLFAALILPFYHDLIVLFFSENHINPETPIPVKDPLAEPSTDTPGTSKPIPQEKETASGVLKPNKPEVPEENSQEMIPITVVLYSDSDSTTNLEGYTVYFDDTALISNKATTNADGEAYFSFPKEQHSSTRSRIFAEYNGKKFSSNMNHIIGRGGVITIKIN